MINAILRRTVSDVHVQTDNERRVSLRQLKNCNQIKIHSCFANTSLENSGSGKDNSGRLSRGACMCTHTLEMELPGAVSLYKSEEGGWGKEEACHPHKVYVCEHRSKNCWGAFLIHSGLRTRSVLSKLSPLLICPPPPLFI